MSASHLLHVPTNITLLLNEKNFKNVTSEAVLLCTLANHCSNFIFELQSCSTVLAKITKGLT